MARQAPDISFLCTLLPFQSRGACWSLLSFADVRDPTNVRFQGQLGKHLLALSFSLFDPVQTLCPFACEALIILLEREKKAQACATFGVALPYFSAVIVPRTWEFSNGLENTEDRWSTGWHGNQHVRLRSTQVSKLRDDLPGSRSTIALCVVVLGAGAAGSCTKLPVVLQGSVGRTTWTSEHHYPLLRLPITTLTENVLIDSNSFCCAVGRTRADQNPAFNFLSHLTVQKNWGQRSTSSALMRGISPSSLPLYNDCHLTMVRTGALITPFSGSGWSPVRIGGIQGGINET
jgi:hypothetical protein